MRCNHSYDIDIQVPGITLVILLVINVFFKDRLSLKNTKPYSSVLHSHTVLMQLCPSGRYRQLNSGLYPNNHIRRSSKIIFNGLVLKFLAI